MAKIGKNVIESLTRSMYEDSRCIYREYIQNAADQIDLARRQHLEENDYYEIHVRIFREERKIEIEDTATGVSRNDRELLLDVAASQKRRGYQKGFRGIGRLGGLGYCSVLTFETSAKGEKVKTVMQWDAEKMNRILDNETDDREAGSVIDECARFEELPEEEQKHYFKVTMERVSDDRLLDIEDIRDYLSMVAPVDYSTAFNRFAAKIKSYVAQNSIALDVYNLYLGDKDGEEQIYKAYTPIIKDKKSGDYYIKDIQMFDSKDEEGNLLYWGWYSISEIRGQIQEHNIPYGIRLRQKNIQVGDERTCRNFFVTEGDKRFAQYFYGELHVETPRLVPDARRDYLRECEDRSAFESLVRENFQVLKELCNDASKIRSALKEIEKADKGQKELVEKKKRGGVTCEAEEEANRKKFEEYQKNREKAEKELERKKQKVNESGSPLGFMFAPAPTSAPGTSGELPAPNRYTAPAGAYNPTPPVQVGKVKETIPNPVEGDASLKPRFRTDGEIYRRFDEKEKNIINSVYHAIYHAIANEDMREGVILLIEKELTK